MVVADDDALSSLLGHAWPMGAFLRTAIGMCEALAQMHARGRIQGNLHPSQFRVARDTGRVTFTSAPDMTPIRAPATGDASDGGDAVTASLFYMAPEQTGRMNRAVDSRSDLYALGVCLYQMITGSLPFASDDPVVLIHAHMARLPAAPCRRVPQIPGAVSDVVMRLLAKGAEDRYQTAGGLLADLRRCQQAWSDSGVIESFVPGTADAAPRLQAPGRLYGREPESQQLQRALQDVVAEGHGRFVLVSGSPGVGKSSFARSLSDSVKAHQGLFAEGKADEQQRPTPYSSIGQAMHGLLSGVLAASAEELQAWTQALREALGPDGHVVAAVLPEVELLLGAQPQLHALAAHEQQSLFQRAFQRLLQAFARPGRPLVLFLDDMQWLDPATLALLAHLLADSTLNHVLLVGAYRSEKVAADEAFDRALSIWRKGPMPLAEIELPALAASDICQLVSDALRCLPSESADLALLVHQRTDGNPFFAAQFMSGLVEQGLLEFDAERAAWSWDAQRIARESRADDVVELMVAKLGRLPAPSRWALQHLSCLGAAIPLPLLCSALGLDEAAMQAALWPAFEAGLLRERGTEIAFSHDRVREAAYATVPDSDRPAWHLRIARLLLDGSAVQEDSAALFLLVNQFNLGAACAVEAAERGRMARLNLDAARLARASSAPASAHKHADMALQLLGPQAFEGTKDAAVEALLLRAECAVLIADFTAAERDLAALQLMKLSRARGAAVCRQRMVLQVLRSDYASAVAAALEGLRPFGIELTPHPAPAQVQDAYEQVMAMLAQRSIESLVDLPRCTDGDVAAAMGVLSELFAPACFTDPALALQHLCEMVRLSLRHGLSPASAHGFAWFGILIGQQFGHYRDGHRFATLAQHLVQRHGQADFEAKAWFALEIASVWTQPLGVAVAHSRAAHDVAVARGDLAVACFSRHHLVNDMLVRGDPLDEVASEIEAGLAFVRRAGFQDVVDELLSQQRFVMSLRGLTAGLGLLSGADFDEDSFESTLTAERMPTMIYWYWVLKAQARFYSGDWAEARVALRQADRLQWSAVHVQVLNCAYFSALALACDVLAAGDAEDLRALDRHRARLAHWQSHNPATSAHKLALVDAEIARLEGRLADAEAHYEAAIEQAHAQKAWPDEALASERAGNHYLGRGLVATAQGLLHRARACYQHWGASGKVARLDATHAFLALASKAAATARALSPMERLDLGTVIKLSQAIAAEIDLPRLIDRLMRLALDHAGAQCAMLMLPVETRWEIQAMAATSGDDVEVQHSPAAGQSPEMPAMVLQHVVNSRKSVLLDDATAPNPYSADPAIVRRRPRSVLCMPLLKQARLVGLLYLENNLATHAFSAELSALLEILASQAAIALENARLYEDLSRENLERRSAEAESRRINLALQESEGRFRRMAETSPDVIWITDLDPERVLYASPSFERIWGCSVDALYDDPRLWAAGIHPDDRDRIHGAFDAWIRGERHGPWEAEFRIQRPDGSVRWIHERGAVIADAQGRPRQVSGISTDISARRSAEIDLQTSEQRFALAVAGSNDGIWDLDFPNGRLFMSERAQQLFGLQPGETVRQREEWQRLISLHPDDAQPQAKQFEDYIAGAIPELDGEWRVAHDDGSFRWVRMRGLCVRDAAGKPVRLAGSVSDLDTHKRTQASLQQAQRLEAVGTLASGIAHDFNNILGAILGFGEMSLRSARSGTRLRRDLDCIMAAGERGRSLVERVLAFSRSGGGERVPVHVEAVVREALELLSAGMPAGVALQSSLSAGRAAILGDATQVHQVVVNLATNAVQAMPGGGKLIVSLRRIALGAARLLTTGPLASGDYLELAVTDSGSGIETHLRERIFDPFMTTKPVGAGSGLGLSLVHGIVTELGGAIDVLSAPGQGSAFTVCLPICGELPEQALAPSRALPRGRQQQVLVVDDEEVLVRLTTETLSELGYLAVGFTSSAAALAAFRTHPDQFDAVLTDERMPDMTGSALVKVLRELRPDLPVLLMSGYVGPEVGRRAQDAGVRTILSKPVARGALAAALAGALPKPARPRPRSAKRSPGGLSPPR